MLSLVALFDGHGEHGAEVARHCADNLPVLLKNALIEFCGLFCLFVCLLMCL